MPITLPITDNRRDLLNAMNPVAKRFSLGTHIQTIETDIGTMADLTTSATDLVGAVNEVAASLAGSAWQPPVAATGYLGTRTIAQIDALTPSLGDSVVAGSAGTPAEAGSVALVIGDVAEFSGAGTGWKKIVSASGGFVPTGTLLIIHSSATLYSPLTDVTDRSKVATFGGASNTPTSKTSPDDGDVREVMGEGSVFENRGFAFDTGTGWLITSPTLSSATPQATGVAAAGTSPAASRADHVHAVTTDGSTLEVNAGAVRIKDAGVTAAKLAAAVAGAGLTGGAGSALDVVANADGSIVVNANDVQVGILATDAQHGNRGGGGLHATVVSGGAAGFMSGTQSTKLDGIETLADVTDTANVTAAGALMRTGGQITGNITCAAAETFDGRDLSVDGAKLDGVASGAQVCSEANVRTALAALTAAPDFNNKTLSNMADGVAADDAASKGQLDTVVSDFDADLTAITAEETDFDIECNMLGGVDPAGGINFDSIGYDIGGAVTVPAVGRAAAATTERWYFRIAAAFREAASRGLKPTGLRLKYHVTVADLDDVKFLVYRITQGAQTVAPTRTTLGGNVDGDYDADHNTAAERGSSNAGAGLWHTCTVTLSSQAYVGAGSDIFVEWYVDGTVLGETALVGATLLCTAKYLDVV